MMFYTDITDEKIISKEEFKKFSDVGSAFTALQANMTNLLRKADHLIIRRACIAQTKAPVECNYLKILR